MLVNLDSPPAGTDSYQWADFIELRAFIHPDGCFSKSDLDGVQRRVTNSNRKFKAEERWGDSLAFIANRHHAFADCYPFKAAENGTYLELSDEPVTLGRYLYLTLLIASSLRFIEQRGWPRITRLFEEISYAIFVPLMPKNSEIRKTWAGGGEEAPYTGTLYQKMCAIARDVRCTANISERDFANNDRGDGGIDMIAWHGMADTREGIPVAFAQCGCSTGDWTHKHLEASPAKLFRQLPLMHRWATYYFLPVDLRWADGDWAYKNDLGEAIFVDRLRIVNLVKEFEIANELPQLKFVDDYRGTWSV